MTLPAIAHWRISGYALLRHPWSGADTMGMRHAILLCLAATACLRAATVEPTFNATDCTTALQNALNSLTAGDTLRLRAQSGPWISGPLHLSKSNVTIQLDPGAELRAKLGSFPNAYGCLLQLDLVNDVVITGYGATLRMLNGTDPAYTTGEGRHCLGICGSNRITVSGLTFTKAGGDGVYIIGGWAGDQTYSGDVTIRDCVMDDNRRQGISVISAQNLLVERCALINTGVTSGTDPMAGIDFEPNAGGERLVNCVLRECEISGNNAVNYATGIHTYLGNLDATSPPVDITIERCRITSTVGSGAAVNLACARAGGPYATYRMTDCLIEDVRGSGLTLKSGSTTCNVQLTRTILRNTFTDTAAWGGTPIYLEGQTNYFDSYGNITFTDCVVVDGRSRPFIRSYEDRSYMVPALAKTFCDGLRGTITVINANAAGRVWNLDTANDVNLTLAVTGLTALPAQALAVTADTAVAVEGGTSAVLRLTRTGATTFPWAGDLAWAGMAQNRIDYGLRPGCLIIPPGAGSATMAIVARSDGLAEGSEPFTATLVARSADYTVTGSPASMRISDVIANTGPTISTPATAASATLALP
jgi:hypothetical protein